MVLFSKSRDYNLFKHFTEELVKDIIDIEVDIYKLSLIDTSTNLYGESMEKIYHPGLKVYCLIDSDDHATDSDDFGPNVGQSVTFAFHKPALDTANIVPEIGDVIDWNSNYYEIDGIIENQLVAGKTDFTHSIICSAHMSRRSRLNIEQIRSGISENL